MAQAMLVHRLRDRLGRDLADAAFSVTSAGTYGLVGEPIEPTALGVLRAYGVAPDGFAARALVADHVSAADLVLGATREHRAAAVTLLPRASGRTFTIREFARLAVAAVDAGAVEAGASGEDVGADALADRARRVVTAAAGQRGYVRPDGPDADDVADPYRREAAAFERAGEHIHTAVEAIVDALAGRAESSLNR